MKNQKNLKEISSEEARKLKENAQQILAFCRQQILSKHPFTGAVAMSMDLVPVRDCRCSTAMTDGKTIFFDIDFLAQLNQEEREFVLGHEVWHNVMIHFLRTEGRIPMLFNYATDMEVNQLLEADGFTSPKDLVYPNSNHGHKSMFNFPDGLSAEEYYELLMNDENQQQNGSGADSSSDKKQKKMSGQFDKHFNPNESLENDGKNEESDKYGKKGKDEDFNPSSAQTDAQRHEAAERIREAIVAAAQMVERTRGTLPGTIKKIVDEITSPKLPWHEILQQFVASSFTNKTNWNRPNRRFAYTGTYLPSHDGEMVKLAIGIDTSGSCEAAVGAFLSEIVGIAASFGQYELHLIQCDTEVKDCRVFNEGNPLNAENPDIEFKGFGGTQLQPIFDYVDLNDLDVDAVVVFTDGYCEKFTEAARPGLPVLWVITPEGVEDRSNFEFGDFIKMDK